MPEVRGKKHTYIIENPHSAYVGQTPTYRLYQCVQAGTGRECLMQVAKQVQHNGLLDRSALVLYKLAQYAARLEKEWESVRTNPDTMLNYDLGFPEILESFISHDQKGRRVNFLAFRNIERLKHVVPIKMIIERDRLRADIRSSVWIIGKALKMLDFAHNYGISLPEFNTSSLLIEPQEHYVMFFDWSNVISYSGRPPVSVAREDIKRVTRVVIDLMEGDADRRKFSSDGFDADVGPYIRLLIQLANGGYSDASIAHKAVYDTVDSIWERKFIPFQTHPRTH